MSEFQLVKLWLVENVGLAKDALHIYLGLILYFGSALLFRWPLRSWKPFAIVLLAALAGEVWDIADTRRVGREVIWWRNWHDIWNTCFWPLAMLLLARFTRLFDR